MKKFFNSCLRRRLPALRRPRSLAGRRSPAGLRIHDLPARSFVLGRTPPALPFLRFNRNYSVIVRDRTPRCRSPRVVVQAPLAAECFCPFFRSGTRPICPLPVL